MEILNIFESKFQDLVKDQQIKSVLLETGDTEEVEQSQKREWKSPEKNNSLSCSYCRSQFESLAQQREHYKLDWHRYNLRQSLAQRPPVTEEEFTEKTTKDDISSISGSDSEKEDTLDTYATAQGKIFLQTGAGKVFSIYTCLLYDKKDDPTPSDLSPRLLHSCVNNRKWAVLMLGGGHFAGAIFDKDTPVLHKTFHCYTVRAGQGGSQSSRDNKGSAPKSAGASLRRYNEQALVQHVRGIVEAWQTELEGCGLIFYRASGAYNKGVLFGGGSPLFKRGDTRLRAVPFSTRRATFKEVKRVHGILSTATVYDSLENAVQHFSKRKTKEQSNKRAKAKTTCIDRARSREIVERPLPIETVDSDSSELDDFDLSAENHELSFQETLQEFDDSLTEEERQKVKKKKKPKKSKAKKLREQEEQRKKELVEVISRGDVDKLSLLLENFLKVEEDPDKFFNEVLDDNSNSFLHMAALNEQVDILDFLLKQGANPCVKNAKQQTAYTCTQSKEIRDKLKEFARENPEKYNYNKAQIPTNVLTPEELSEKKKAQRKIKKEKEKIKKKEQEEKRKEDAEKERFLKLSDREKRALAAERRILSQNGTVIVRCFLCASDISGKVPFEYGGNRFCSVECLKGHRMKNPVVLS